MSSVTEPVAATAAPLATTTYVQSKAYVLSVMGGILLITLIRAFLFRFSHPDPFYEATACVLLAFMASMVWLPPRLVLSPERIQQRTFGLVGLDIPWVAINRLELFRTPVIKTMGASPSGGHRAIGFVIEPDQKIGVRPKTGAYGYDAVLISCWEISIDAIAEQCLAYWHASGGAGDLIDHIRIEIPEPLQLGG